MADLIDRDALMKEICENECGSVCDEECENVMCNYYDYIMDAPAVNRWIPCSERLPEPLQNVIVCTDIKTVTLAWINGDGWYFADTGSSRIEFYGFDAVTHWMPLHEPPEKE